MKTQEIRDFYAELEYWQEKGWNVVYASDTNAIIKKGERIRYVYSAGSEMIMNFDLVSHVATGKEFTFNAMLKRCGIKIAQKETETDYFDVIIEGPNFKY